MKTILLLILVCFMPEAHVSTHIEEISLEMMVSQSESIFVVEETAEKSVSRSYKGKSYQLPEKSFKILSVLKSNDKTHPESLTVTSDRDRKDSELQIDYEISKLSKFPIYHSPARELWAPPGDKKKILFVNYDSSSKKYIHPWNWSFVSEKFTEKIQALIKANRSPLLR